MSEQVAFCRPGCYNCTNKYGGIQRIMDFLHQLWPTPFKVKKGNVVSLIVYLVIFLVVCALVGWLISLLASIPVIGIIFSILGSLIGIYSLVGIILCLLKFFNVIS